MSGLEGAAGLSRRLSAIAGPAANRRTLTTLQAAAVREAKILCPRRSGNLSRTIHPGAVTDSSAEVVVSADYARPVEFGAQPHDIEPKTPGGVLAFGWPKMGGAVRLTGSARRGSSMCFFRKVHHPGNRAQPFIVPGMIRAVENGGLLNQIVSAWNNAD